MCPNFHSPLYKFQQLFHAAIGVEGKSLMPLRPLQLTATKEMVEWCFLVHCLE